MRSLRISTLMLSPLIFFALSACNSRLEEWNAPPSMSAVGSGAIASQTPNFGLGQRQDRPQRREFQSLWTGKRMSFFSDRRARQIGDVITVAIAIADKANLDNRSSRNRDSSSNAGLGLDYVFGRGAAYKGNANLNVNSGSSMQGRGGVNRSEEITLRVAALVTDVLDNKNLMISGSQEVLVNHEIRVLNVAGIVRPGDIGPKNTVSYDKIAEARISYGGRGQISEVQKVPAGQRLYDKYIPF